MFLDTSAYSGLERGVLSIVGVVREKSSITLALPVIAELRYGFLKGSRQAQNEALLQRFLAQPQISIAMPTLSTTEVYAELELFCQRKGRSLGKNDIWIAALAREADDTLVTFDHDFEA